MKKSLLTPACLLLQGGAPTGSNPGLPVAAATAGEDGECAVGLREEAANMRRLVQAQQKAQTPLADSSIQARVVLGQF
ncbi:hypothetical protein [Geomonas azotofigens]|uniref:hypothetical protein n=1 Tax=Geomonas azotofigens TaxID=2843196 RepID=UPI001C106AA2|nr:hypothetical protein [Geomonas azotofigens]MBU5613473.1 hypothetical protein [Geomonas azotofigens]